MKRYWLALCLFAHIAVADTHFVDINNVSPSSPYTNWATAAVSIEDAVSVSSAGDLVLVAPGTYTPMEPDGISVDKAITIKSQNGPATTIIDGQNFTRGFKVNNPEAVIISGFTITRGYGQYYDIYSHTWEPDMGGGIVCYPYPESRSIVSNCIIRECNGTGGGGMFGGTAIDCQFIGNVSTYDGGGLQMAEAKGCLFRYNHANYDGGGLADSFCRNCTIIENTCGGNGGGVRGYEIYNSIVYDNLKTTDNSPNNIVYIANTYYSCSPDLTQGTNGNITNAPMFISQATGNFRLLETSPCVDAGLSAYASSLPTDLDGKQRIQGIRVDMGAYEYQPLELENTIHLKTTLLQSSNLVNWAETSYIMEWTVPMESSNAFFRTKLETLP